MLLNFFKTAWRNLKKDRIFSAISIFGLAVGLTCFMLIAAFVYQELSYDKYSRDADLIYRVQFSVTGNGDIAVYPNVDDGVGPGMMQAFPEIAECTRMTTASDYVKYNNRQFREPHLAFVDSNFLSFFSIPFIEGNPATALVQPKSAVITRDIALKYFGNDDPLGKTLAIGIRKTAYQVTGVINPLPVASHFHFEIFLSISSFPTHAPSWSNLGYYTYIRLNKNVDPLKLQAKFPELVAKHIVPEVQHDMGVSFAEAKKTVKNFRFTLLPLRQIHLYSHTKYELEANGDIQYIYIFSVLAFFVLLLACVNFTNLSTARAARRAREVGIRKVLGSLRKQLVIRFLSESVLHSLLALLLAFMLAFILLPLFNRLSGKSIHFNFFFQPSFSSVLLLAGLLSGILAGLYPAFFLSGFNTIKVLKGMSLRGTDKKPLRSSLVVFQFFVSTTLIIATLVVYRQLQFMQNQKLGYNQDQVLFLPEARLLGPNQAAFKQRLLADSRVESASMSRSVPGMDFMGGTEIYPRNAGSNGVTIHTNIFQVDEDYLRTLGISVLQGRNFSRDFSTDSQGVIINEAAVRKLGWTNSTAVGQSIIRSGQLEYKVLGVVKDFHYASLRQEIAPLMMLLGHNAGGLIIKVKAMDIPGFLKDLKKDWAAFNAQGSLEYQFLDETVAALYRSERHTQALFFSFAMLAIIIASLGLFGLSAYVIQQRTKEIGIRKVLGASVPHVLLLLSREFLILVVIAFSLSIPAGWWAMSSWLEHFAYRTSINIWVFAIAGFSALVIALLTISFQALRAAVANPVKSLKTE